MKLQASDQPTAVRAAVFSLNLVRYYIWKMGDN